MVATQRLPACVGLWFGFPHLLNYLVYTSLFGGALTLLLIQFRQWPLPYALGSQEWLMRLHGKDSGIPYGIALAMGASDDLSGNGMDKGGGCRSAFRSLTAGNISLTRFRYASLTML